MPLAMDPSIDTRAFALDEEEGPHSGSSAMLVGFGRLRAAFQDGLMAEGLTVYMVESEDQAVSVAESLTPSLMVVEGGQNGEPLPLLARLASANPAGRILFLLGKQDGDLAVEAMAWGAHEVISPPHSVGNILFRARVMAARGNRASLTVPGGSFVVVDRRSRTILDTETPANLTGREFELLEVLASAAGRVVSREELLSEIWGEEQESEAVLDATIHRLRRKLESNPANPRILTTVRGIGYRLEETRLQFT